MKYPHIVVKNGVWYPAGTDVPADISISDQEEENLQEPDKPKRGRKPKEKTVDGSAAE